jgi:hypothetical protein
MRLLPAFLFFADPAGSHPFDMTALPVDPSTSFAEQKILDRCEDIGWYEVCNIMFGNIP